MEHLLLRAPQHEWQDLSMQTIQSHVRSLEEQNVTLVVVLVHPCRSHAAERVGGTLLCEAMAVDGKISARGEDRVAVLRAEVPGGAQE